MNGLQLFAAALLGAHLEDLLTMTDRQIDTYLASRSHAELDEDCKALGVTCSGRLAKRCATLKAIILERQHNESVSNSG